MRRLSRWWTFGLQFLIAILFGFPIYWTLVTAFNNPNNVYRIPPAFFPKFDVRAMVSVLVTTHWLHYILNSVFICTSTVALVLVTSALAGYALSDLKFRGQGIVFLFILGSMMVPAQAILIPQYLVLFKLRMLNTYSVEIIPFAASAMGVMLFRQFFKTLPGAYREAVEMEGGGRMYYLWRIAFPLAKSSAITVMLLAFIGSWNMFQWPLIMTDTRSIQPVEVVLGHYMHTYQANWPEMASAVTLAIAPIAVMFFIAQRHIVGGVAGRGSGIRE